MEAREIIDELSHYGDSALLFKSQYDRPLSGLVVVLFEGLSRRSEEAMHDFMYQYGGVQVPLPDATQRYDIDPETGSYSRPSHAPMHDAYDSVEAVRQEVIEIQDAAYAGNGLAYNFSDLSGLAKIQADDEAAHHVFSDVTSYMVDYFNRANFMHLPHAHTEETSVNQLGFMVERCAARLSPNPPIALSEDRPRLALSIRRQIS